jgi:3-oxoacyl-[acyl-carrier protein] reductase
MRAAEERLGTYAGSVMSFTSDLTDPASVSRMI